MSQVDRIANWVFFGVAAVMVLVPPMSVDPRAGKTLAVYESGLVREIVGTRFDPELGRVVHETRELPEGRVVKYHSLVLELLRPRSGGAFSALSGIQYGRLAAQLIALIVFRFTLFPLLAAVLAGAIRRYRVQGRYPGSVRRLAASSSDRLIP